MNDYIREILEGKPELLRKYEKSEARYILQLSDDYDTISIDLDIEKEEMERLIIALAEVELSLDEWLCFKLKELIISNKLSGKEQALVKRDEDAYDRKGNKQEHL